MTERAELEPEGWERYEVGEKAEGEEGLPLTQEERVLRGVREEEQAEAEVGRGRGSRERRELVGGRVKVGISEEAKGALEALGRGEGGDLVQLVCCLLSFLSLFLLAVTAAVFCGFQSRITI